LMLKKGHLKIVKLKPNYENMKVPSDLALCSNKIFVTSNTAIKIPDVDAPRRRRRAKSRAFKTSRDIYRSTNNTESFFSDWSSSNVSRTIDLSIESVSKSNGAVRSRLAQVPKGHEGTLECDYFSLEPLDTHRGSCADQNEEAGYTPRSSSVSLADMDSRLNLSTSQTQSKSVKIYSDWSDELQSIEGDYDTLPPYHEIVPQMFYRFCGISNGSNSRWLQSKDDFRELLKCLGMKDFMWDFLVWFPKAAATKSNCGYISLKMFSELFSGKFAQTFLEERWEYGTLCSAILTMNSLDKKKLNRIEFPQFLRLYRGLYDSEVSVGNVSAVFNKYDKDRTGILTIVDIFNFCCDEDLGLE